MNRVDRLVGILLLLQSRRLIRAQDISEHFEISLRTVYRDLKALEEAGVPISAEAGVGYALMTGYHVPPVMFTHEEASALFIGSEFAARLTDASLKKHIVSALNKIKAVLPQETRDYLEKLGDRTEIVVRDQSPQEGFRNDALMIIQNAIVKRRILKMDYYTSSRDEFSTRDIEPLGCVYYSDHWHLIAYCRMRKDLRDFRVDRIKLLTETLDFFKPRPDFSLKEYMQTSLPKSGVERPFEVRVRFTLNAANALRQQNRYGLVDEKRVGDKIELTFLVSSLRWIASWLLSFGTFVEILSPHDLTAIIAEEAERVMNHYQRLAEKHIAKA
jgi:predicted DNA-binding transcriptional regulator YafY